MRVTKTIENVHRDKRTRKHAVTPITHIQVLGKIWPVTVRKGGCVDFVMPRWIQLQIALLRTQRQKQHVGVRCCEQGLPTAQRHDSTD